MGSLTSSWMMNLCGSPICSNHDVLVSCAFKEIFNSNTCMNHLVAISIVTPLTLVPVLRLLVVFPKIVTPARQLFTLSSPLQLVGVVLNGCLGSVHAVLGLWMLRSNFSNQDAVVYRPHLWLLTLSQGFSLVLTGFALAIRRGILGLAFARSWSVSLIIYTAFICCSSVAGTVAAETVTIKACLDFLSLPGAVIFLLHSIQSSHDEEGHEGSRKGLYKKLKTDRDSDLTDSSGSQQVTAFAEAGILSEMSFWWLNPLLKMGYDKPLEEEDMPLLGATDQAQNQYLMFLEKLNNKKCSRSQSYDATPSILWTIVSLHKRGIMVSGLFALLKVLTLSTGPLLLRAFINLSTGKGTYKHEGFMLAAMMFFCKCCESLSQRQWYFRTRRLGLQVRSLLSAAIYKKQQKLSSSAKMKHSSGEIMNYVTVDAYRVGEFPYWFHQTWTTIVQLCIALAILYNAVGTAMVSSLVVVIITVLCNAPLAKLQT